jgi:hypothetical protein
VPSGPYVDAPSSGTDFFTVRPCCHSNLSCCPDIQKQALWLRKRTSPAFACVALATLGNAAACEWRARASIAAQVHCARIRRARHVPVGSAAPAALARAAPSRAWSCACLQPSAHYPPHECAAAAMQDTKSNYRENEAGIDYGASMICALGTYSTFLYVDITARNDARRGDASGPLLVQQNAFTGHP